MRRTPMFAVDTERSSIVPMIMIIEDEEKKLKMKKEGLEKRGCRVISIRHSDEAIRGIYATPSIDLIVTDIDLTGSGTDRSGIAFARFVKALELDTPLCGYSSKFDDEELTTEEKEFFDCWYPKATQSAEQINAMYDALKDKAVDHRLSRMKEADDLIQALKQKYSIMPEVYDQIRELLLNVDSSSDIERILRDANYTLKILHPSDVASLCRPVLVWLKKSDDLFEAEVYGHTTLYGYGETEDIAVDRLIELMQLFAEDALNDPADTFQGTALKLREFLAYVFGKRN
jgi:CheY-like chemotaxis protein